MSFAQARNHSSACGAYESEMGSEPTLDRQVACFLGDLRATYAGGPEETVASRHLAAIAREAELVLPRRSTQPVGWRRIMNRNSLFRPAVTLGAATLAAVMGTAGLAVAGVNLPDPAQEAFEQVGITLPNQAGGGERRRSDAVRSVIDSTPPSERRGCAFGHRVAEAAKGSPLPEQARANCEQGEKNGDARNGADGNNSNRSQFGRDTADRARGLGGATVEQRRSFGQGTAEQATELGGAPNGTPAPHQRPVTPPTGGGTTPAPDGTPNGAPEGTPAGQPEALPVPEGTPTGPPQGTPTGRP